MKVSLRRKMKAIKEERTIIKEEVIKERAMNEGVIIKEDDINEGAMKEESVFIKEEEEDFIDEDDHDDEDNHDDENRRPSMAAM